MRRILTTALILGAITLGANPATAREPGWRLKECRYQFKDGHANWTQDEVRWTIKCAAAKFGVSVTTALYVAYRESHYGQYATNSYSGACGVFQHIPRYFPGRVNNVPDKFKPLGSSCYNARSNILAALYMARNGWGPWGM